MHFILGSKDNILPLIRFAKLAIWRSRKKGFGFVIYAGTNQARINIKQGTFYFILVCKDGIFVRGLAAMTTPEDIRNFFQTLSKSTGVKSEKLQFFTVRKQQREFAKKKSSW